MYLDPYLPLNQDSIRPLPFQAKYNIDFHAGKFHVFVASSRQEIYQALKLRREIFLPHKTDLEIDIDEFDFLCDHLLIEDTETKQIIGTYRVLCSTFTCRFYTQNEFELQSFLSTPDVKMELGRACIQKEYRGGKILDLLWRGISKYLQVSGARYLFGCSSAFDLDFSQAKGVYNYLISQYSSDQFLIQPKRRVPNMDTIDAKMDAETLMKVPTLLLSYIKAGAKVYGEPCWDPDFNCVDFLTILDIKELHPKYRMKYFENEGCV